MPGTRVSTALIATAVAGAFFMTPGFAANGDTMRSPSDCTLRNGEQPLSEKLGDCESVLQPKKTVDPEMVEKPDQPMTESMPVIEPGEVPSPTAE